MQGGRSDPLLLPALATALFTALFALEARNRLPPDQWLLALMVVAVLSFLYLGAGWRPGTALLQQWTQGTPGRVYVLPVLLWLLGLLWGWWRTQLAPEDVILGLAFLLIPVELARREVTPWRGAEVAMGWLALAVPLSGPLPGQQPFPLEVGLRAGAFLLPGFFLLFSRGRPEGFRLLLGVMYVWYSIEFGAYPRLGFPVVSLYHLYAFVIVLYSLMVAGWLPRVGFGLAVTGQELRVAGRELLLFMPVGLGLGVVTGFLNPHRPELSLVETGALALAILFLTGIPEELLFRGIIHTFIEDRVANPRLALALSSLLFGAAHLNNPPMVGVYFLLASIAGWFYGRAFQATRRIAPAALVHTAVDWVWAIAL